MEKWILKNALFLAWGIALIGLAVSLFYGEILHMEPCRLCWYQRVAILPLAFFLGIAIYKRNRKLATYCIPFAIFGGIVALYQVITQYFPSTHVHALCGSAEACALPIFYLFGVISFPLLSMLGFAAITALLLLSENRSSR